MKIPSKVLGSIIYLTASFILIASLVACTNAVTSENKASDVKLYTASEAVEQ